MFISFFQRYLLELQDNFLIQVYTVVTIVLGSLLICNYITDKITAYKRKHKLNKKRLT
ncbi:MAG: hypothetical protein HZA34_00755 [Candidatus Pacebacteria bacterium]|nr:hypothetical protein [Candidatus Paceibacterota bacterium]